jgi:hypothetical protein
MGDRFDKLFLGEAIVPRARKVRAELVRPVKRDEGRSR